MHIMLGPSSTIHPPSTMGRVWLDMAAWAQTNIRCQKVKIVTPRRNANTPWEGSGGGPARARAAAYGRGGDSGAAELIEVSDSEIRSTP